MSDFVFWYKLQVALNFFTFFFLSLRPMVLSGLVITFRIAAGRPFSVFQSVLAGPARSASRQQDRIEMIFQHATTCDDENTSKLSACETPSRRRAVLPRHHNQLRVDRIWVAAPPFHMR